MARREFYIVIEKDENGEFIGEAPQLKSCRSYGKTLDELIANTREAIELCLKDDGLDSHSQFIGVYKIEVQAELS
jgi:predicted RNase H-like HicB family nuclease